jgi:hypothetical protein
MPKHVTQFTAQQWNDYLEQQRGEALLAPARGSDAITFIGREDEMLIFHRGGKYWMTLYAPSPSDAIDLADWIQRRQNAEVSEGGTRDSRIETAAQSRPSLH